MRDHTRGDSHVVHGQVIIFAQSDVIMRTVGIAAECMACTEDCAYALDSGAERKCLPTEDFGGKMNSTEDYTVE